MIVTRNKPFPAYNFHTTLSTPHDADLAIPLQRYHASFVSQKEVMRTKTMQGMAAVMMVWKRRSSGVSVGFTQNDTLQHQGQLCMEIERALMSLPHRNHGLGDYVG